MPYTSLTSPTQAGELKLDAAQHSDLPGLTNTTNTDLQVSLSAKGQWCLYNVPTTNPDLVIFNSQTDWKGYQLTPKIYGNHSWRKDKAPAGCVLAEILDANGFIKDTLAAPASVDLPPGHKVVFVINDDVRWYADNSGQITLSYSCSPKSFFPAGSKWSVRGLDDNASMMSYHPTPWEFENQTVGAEGHWKCSYSPIQGSDNRFASAEGWEMVFVTENRLIGIHSGSLWRFGKRINPGSGSKPRPLGTTATKSCNPSGSKWSVATMNDDGAIGTFLPSPWEFQDQSVNAGTLGNGSYSAIPGSDNRIACKTTSAGVTNEFEVVFLTPIRFIATKGGSLYQFGKKI